MLFILVFDASTISPLFAYVHGTRACIDALRKTHQRVGSNNCLITLKKWLVGTYFKFPKNLNYKCNLTIFDMEFFLIFI